MPWSKPRSESMLVTEALEMMPLSRRLSEQSRPAIVHNRTSTFTRRFFSLFWSSASSCWSASATNFVLGLPSSRFWASPNSDDSDDMVCAITSNRDEYKESGQIANNVYSQKLLLLVVFTSSLCVRYHCGDLQVPLIELNWSLFHLEGAECRFFQTHANP